MHKIKDKMVITVPATTANLGPGFDCMGMALQLYNKTTITLMQSPPPSPALVVEAGEGVPTDGENLIYKTIVDFCKEAGVPVPSLHMLQEDAIPMARGLGSSAACIVTGLLAGNAIAQTQYDNHRLLDIAADIEGHPDNVAPAFLGGAMVGAMTEKGLAWHTLPIPKALRFALMVPNFELHTEKARGVLPATYSRQDGVFNASRTALLTAAFCLDELHNLETALDDCVHQPYRIPLVPNMTDLFAAAKQCGAYGTFLSGAGPALIAVVDATKADAFMAQMSMPPDWTVRWIEPDRKGARIC